MADNPADPSTATPTAAADEHPLLQARNVAFDWSDLAVHYLPNEPFATHFCNVMHLVQPAGEEFIVEVFKQALPLIKDPQLRLDVQGFIGQEAMHSKAHASAAAHLCAQGIDVTPFTDQTAWFFHRLLGGRPQWSRRRQHAWLLERVAVVAAIEHYTALLGEWILDTPQLDALGGDPRMLDLLRWHGAEEVEHKSVAFDVMRHLQAGYVRRARTQIAVTVILPWLWARGIAFLYSVDPELPAGTTPRWRDWIGASRRGILPGPAMLVRTIGAYFRPGFHPSQTGGLDKARQYLTVSPAARATH